MIIKIIPELRFYFLYFKTSMVILFFILFITFQSSYGYCHDANKDFEILKERINNMEEPGMSYSNAFYIAVTEN